MCAQSLLCANEAPLASDSPYLSRDGSSLKIELEAEAARVALRSGLSATAANIFRSLLKDSGLSAEERSELTLDYLAALIAQSSFSDAALVYESVSEAADSDRLSLYAACIHYGSGDNPAFGEIQKNLSDINPAALRDIDRPWYFLLQGALANSKGRDDEAENFFRNARAVATSPMQSALFSSLILRQRILASPTDESLLVAVREQFEALAGQSAAFPFLREYVVLLHGIGRGGEAISALEAELSNASAGYSIDERANLLLLKSLILGLDTTAGWSSLKELVRSGIDSEASLIALQLLGSVRGREADLMSLLNEIISRPEPHPLLAQLYFMRCQLALANPETTAIAEADARFLLEQFPGLTEITSVYRLLVYAALKRSPPRYRVAADYLLELREQSSEAKEKAYLNRLIGDCYFLNRDYANAVDFYVAANAAYEGDADNEGLYHRLILSLIRSGQYAEAVETIDQADFSGKVDDAGRWQAEWSIALALQASGENEQALERLRRLIGGDTAAVPTLLDLRLRWLEAHISLQSGDPVGVADKIDTLLARIDTMPDETLGSEEISRLKSELLLLSAKSRIGNGDVESSFELLSSIRREFQNSVAAERSYFTEAAYHASVGDYASAQAVLVSFAEAYPESAFVAQALFQAALHCQTRGPAHYREAVVLLDRLVQSYKGSELAYQAGLKQGDLLRLMNDFAGAQLIYENLINSYPSHRLRYAAEMSRADCIAALSQSSDDQLLEAVRVLERLVDRPDLPVEVQIEAGYKWGSILQRNGDAGEAISVYGLVASRYLLDAQNASGLTSVGRYWLSRTVFSLGTLLEDQEASEEAVKLYRKLVAFNLPGRSLALSRIDQLRLVESP